MAALSPGTGGSRETRRPGLQTSHKAHQVTVELRRRYEMSHGRRRAGRWHARCTASTTKGTKLGDERDSEATRTDKRILTGFVIGVRRSLGEWRSQPDKN